jgi:hypothetical protein
MLLKKTNIDIKDTVHSTINIYYNNWKVWRLKFKPIYTTFRFCELYIYLTFLNICFSEHYIE